MTQAYGRNISGENPMFLALYATRWQKFAQQSYYPVVNQGG